MFGVLVVVLGGNPIAPPGVQLGPKPCSGHSFFSRCESLVVLAAAHPMPTAESGQLSFPVSVDAYSCLSFGHSHGSLREIGR